jgi:hypothetical protein
MARPAFTAFQLRAADALTTAGAGVQAWRRLEAAMAPVRRGRGMVALACVASWFVVISISTLPRR